MEPSELVIESATPEDAREIAALMRLSVDTALPFLPKLHTPEQDLDFISSSVIPNNTVLVARDQKRCMVGFIAFDDVWINHLYLLPEFGNRGLGSQLLNIVKTCREKVWLWTFQRNVVARRFYEKHGFVAVKETDGCDNEEREPDILYEWTR